MKLCTMRFFHALILCIPPALYDRIDAVGLKGQHNVLESIACFPLFNQTHFLCLEHRVHSVVYFQLSVGQGGVRLDGRDAKSCQL